MPTDSAQTAAALLAACRASQDGGDLPAAMAHGISALAVARQGNSQPDEFDALLACAGLCSRADDIEGCIRHLEMARPLLVQLGDERRAFRLHNLLANALGVIKDFEKSFACHAQALRIAEQLGDERSIAITRSNLVSRWLDQGEHHHEQGREEDAVHAWRQAVEMGRELLDWARRRGDASLEFTALANLGPALQHLGQADEALALLLQCDALAEAARMHHALANTALYKARILLDRGDTAAARTAALAGLAIGEAHSNLVGCAELHLFLCEVEERGGQLGAALAHHKRHHALLALSTSRAASERSRLLAVQLQTERALNDAATQRARAAALLQANDALSEQAQSLSVQAQQDPLTGLANRRRLDSVLQAAHADAVARAMPLCIGLLDIDHFKRVNDAFGHSVGDQVLQQVGRLLQAQCRDDDLAARYGGEEFVVIIRHVGLARAAAVCERLRLSIEKHAWGTLVPGLAVTASIGLSDISSLPDMAAGLASADARLYSAKARGRNCVVHDAADGIGAA